MGTLLTLITQLVTLITTSNSDDSTSDACLIFTVMSLLMIQIIILMNLCDIYIIAGDVLDGG